MAVKKIFQGEDYLNTFSRQVNKVVTTHAEISEIEVHLYGNSTELIKFSKTDQTANGFDGLTQEIDEGKYTFKVPKETTETWRPDMIVTAEFSFTLATGDVRRFKIELGCVEKMNS